MPRRWTNADQYKGGDPRALAKLSDELRRLSERRPPRAERAPHTAPRVTSLDEARALLGL